MCKLYQASYLYLAIATSVLKRSCIYNQNQWHAIAITGPIYVCGSH